MPSSIFITSLTGVFLPVGMDTSQDVITSDEENTGSNALDSRVQTESGHNVDEKKKTKDSQPDEAAQPSYKPDFEWMKSLFKDMS